MSELSQVNAPIYEALRKFRRMRVVPFDVPGHKRGRGNMELTEFLGEDCMNVDVNSMKPLDNLCHRGCLDCVLSEGLLVPLCVSGP